MDEDWELLGEERPADTRVQEDSRKEEESRTLEQHIREQLEALNNPTPEKTPTTTSYTTEEDTQPEESIPEEEKPQEAPPQNEDQLLESDAISKQTQASVPEQALPYEEEPKETEKTTKEPEQEQPEQLQEQEVPPITPSSTSSSIPGVPQQERMDYDWVKPSKRSNSIPAPHLDPNFELYILFGTLAGMLMHSLLFSAPKAMDAVL